MAKTSKTAEAEPQEDVATAMVAGTQPIADITPPAPGDEEEMIRTKMRGGLTREQALQVIAMQREADARSQG